MILNLDLPHYEHTLRKKNDKIYIYDTIRQKYILLTPEEWVRQQIITWLSTEYHYPKCLMQIEKRHYYNKNVVKRTDIVIFDRNGNPFMLVECKALDVPLSEQTLWQAATYNQSIGAKFILLTNGQSFCVCSVKNGQIQFHEKIPTLPD